MHIKGLIYEEQLKILDWFSLEKWKMRSDLIAPLNFLMRRNELFFLVSGDRNMKKWLTIAPGEVWTAY
ncbi:hypothetical protein BTVI_69300 [Pitangus sulphuratus]|nr:hypothetical protein BTVI_69300 [Pitangus sulphuratus]